MQNFTENKIFKRSRFYIGNLIRFISIPKNQLSIRPEVARTIFGVSFADEGENHHIVKTLKEYDKTPNIYFKDTSMYNYLKHFKPKSIVDLIDSDENTKKLPLFLYPWGTFKKNEYETKKDPLKSRFCGPSDDQYIKNHFDHVIELYKRIKKTGYRPWSYNNGFIGGTILSKNNGDFRFIVLQGNHRFAILVHIGLDKIAVRSIPGYVRIVKERELYDSPIVKNGFCSKDTASKIFNLFFQENEDHLRKFIDNIKE